MNLNFIKLKIMLVFMLLNINIYAAAKVNGKQAWTEDLKKYSNNQSSSVVMAVSLDGLDNQSNLKKMIKESIHDLIKSGDYVTEKMLELEKANYTSLEKLIKEYLKNVQNKKSKPALLLKLDEQNKDICAAITTKEEFPRFKSIFNNNSFKCVKKSKSAFATSNVPDLDEIERRGKVNRGISPQSDNYIPYVTFIMDLKGDQLPSRSSNAIGASSNNNQKGEKDSKEILASDTNENIFLRFKEEFNQQIEESSDKYRESVENLKTSANKIAGKIHKKEFTKNNIDEIIKSFDIFKQGINLIRNNIKGSVESILEITEDLSNKNVDIGNFDPNFLKNQNESIVNSFKDLENTINKYQAKLQELKASEKTMNKRNYISQYKTLLDEVINFINELSKKEKK